MKAIILSVGNEVLSGKTINTNHSFISKNIEPLGITTVKGIVVGDDFLDIKKEVNTFINSDANILFTIGGLGPTHDDLTKEAVASTLGLELVENEVAKEDMFNYFKEVKTDSNYKQVLFPKDAIILNNKLGSADGAIIYYLNKIIVLLVGPPYELEPMFNEGVIPNLQNLGKNKLIQEYIVMGNSESYFENLLYDLYLEFDGVDISPYASNGYIRYRLMADVTKLKDFNAANSMFKDLLDNYIISDTDKSIEEVLVETLINKNLTISFAESITGGMLASSIINVPNASKVIKESLVTYSNEAKMKYLDVNFTSFDAVSLECAKQMAIGLEKSTFSDINVSVTGYAGPDGEDVGKYFYAIKSGDLHISGEAKTRGNRNMIRERVTKYVLYQTYIFVKEVLE